jgi:valyl-tRNA synthetase
MAEGGDRSFYTVTTLVRVMDACLRLLHPFTPFVTEELWQSLKEAAIERNFKPFSSKNPWENALIVAGWPEAGKPEGWEETAVSEFSVIQEAVRAIRNIRAEKKVQPGKKIPALISAGTKIDILRGQCSTLAALASLDKEKSKLASHIKGDTSGYLSIVVSGLEIYLALSDLVDDEKDEDRLRKELEVINSQIDRLEKLLASDFAAKAPAAVVEKEKAKLKDYLETREKLKLQLA